MSSVGDNILGSLVGKKNPPETEAVAESAGGSEEKSVTIDPTGEAVSEKKSNDDEDFGPHSDAPSTPETEAKSEETAEVAETSPAEGSPTEGFSETAETTGGLGVDDLRGSGPSRMWVTRTYKEGKLITSSEEDSELIEVPVIPDGAMTAKVWYDSKMTLNMENYESVSVGVGVTLPAYLTELDEAYRAAKSFVDDRLSSEIAAINEYRKKKRGK